MTSQREIIYSAQNEYGFTKEEWLALMSKEWDWVASHYEYYRKMIEDKKATGVDEDER